AGMSSGRSGFPGTAGSSSAAAPAAAFRRTSAGPSRSDAAPGGAVRAAPPSARRQAGDLAARRERGLRVLARAVARARRELEQPGGAALGGADLDAAFEL